MQLLVYFTVISCLFFFTRASAELITRLPGQPANVTFKQYSGYIVTNSKHGRALFYYLVEVDAADPLLHPLTLWLNGGPGCSSLGFGAFMEHGPFQPGEDGYLAKNQYSWNLESNMLYVESPVGVGFSYSNTSSDYIGVNDTFTAEENLQFLVNWFKEFPKYRNSDLFLTGESYAGHYVPQLAALVLDYNKHSNGKPIRLKAVALGNPLLDWEISIDNTEFLWSHGVISDEVLMLRKSVCSRPREAKESLHYNLSKECTDVIRKEAVEIGGYTDFGDLILPLCTSTSLFGQSVYLGKFHTLHTELPMRSVIPGDPCIGDRIHQYLNKPQVQEALHANTTNLPYLWEFCGGSLSLSLPDQTISNIFDLLITHFSSGM
ncbi:hypothetical protein CRYUN_Cryun04dG0206200 [Craigia yunnanensis]